MKGELGVVRLDRRKQVCLAKWVIDRPADMYLVDVDDDGVITLTPAIVIPAEHRGT